MIHVARRSGIGLVYLSTQDGKDLAGRHDVAELLNERYERGAMLDG